MILKLNIQDQDIQIPLLDSAQLQAELQRLEALEEDQRLVELNQNFKWLQLLSSAEDRGRQVVIHKLVHDFSFVCASSTVGKVLLALVQANDIDHARAVIALEETYIFKQQRCADASDRQVLPLAKVVNQAFIAALLSCKPGVDKEILTTLRRLGAEVELYDRSDIPWIQSCLARVDLVGEDEIAKEQYNVLLNLLSMRVSLKDIKVRKGSKSDPEMPLVDLVVKKYTSFEPVRQVDRCVITLLLLAGSTPSDTSSGGYKNPAIASLTHPHRIEAEALTKMRVFLERTQMFLEEYMNMRNVEGAECFSRWRRAFKSPCTQENKLVLARTCLAMIKEARASNTPILLNLATISAHPTMTLKPDVLESNIEGRFKSQILDVHNEMMLQVQKQLPRQEVAAAATNS